MRPINIEICAFGPYKDNVFVDFTKFYDNGIFLITGDTGSGKTSIFDAICFALFGNASGVNRDKSSFRSDFADDSVRTYVKFEFSHKDVIYKIERSPSYVRKKKRGDGTTLVSGDASLIYLDNVITGDKNVTDKCIEILGINYLQFKQISMIAQGEFLKLLLAKSSDRAVIFRKIFDTDIYKEISDRLKEKYLEVKREYLDEGIVLSNLKNSVILDDVIDEDIGINEFLELLLHNINSQKKEEEKLSVNKNKLMNKIQKITTKIENSIEINDNIKKYETLIIEKDNKLKSDISVRRDIVNKNKDIYDFIVPLYEEVLRCKNIINDKNKELLNNNKLLSSVIVEYKQLMVEYENNESIKDKISKLKIDLFDLEKKLPLFLEIDAMENELAGLNNIFNQLKILELEEFVEKINRNNRLMDNYKKESDNFLKVKDKYNSLSDKYNYMYNQFVSCQAGILAQSLIDGCPCPVCGSLEHPKRASNDVEVVTKEELDSFNDIIIECQKDLENLSGKVSSIGKELEISNREIEGIDIDNINEELLKYEELVDDFVDVSNYNINDVIKDISFINASIVSKKELLDVNVSCLDLESKIKNIKLEIGKLENYVNEVSKRYEDKKNEKFRLESVVKLLKKEIDNYNSELLLVVDKYSNMYRKFGYESEDEYLEIKLDKDVYYKYLDDVDKYDKDLIELDAKIKVIKEVVNGREIIDIDNLKKDKAIYDEEMIKIDLSLKSIHSKINNNVLVYDRIKSVYTKQEDIEKKLALYEDLSNTANGNIKGKNKIEFEQYVQAYYFDNVLVSANKRFQYMTDSRYLLVRKVDSYKLSDKLGLELEVIDNYTGKRRDVSSLSGGESFKAALSLSLGISDVIQSYAGGVFVEAMFIDEGFGSLDSESLEQAMNAISSLGSNNSLIGIISHVNELKDRIDKKIVVKKSNSGSSVSVLI